MRKQGINQNNIEITRYEIENKLNQLRAKKNERKLKLKNCKNKKKNERKEKLVKALEENVLEVRSDSKLCNGYIEGIIKGWNISKMVRRMGEMKYLHEYCDFDYTFIQADEEFKEEIEPGFYPDMTKFERAEEISLNKNDGYPKIIQWQAKDTKSK
jgi:hypothetical protein